MAISRFLNSLLSDGRVQVASAVNQAGELYEPDAEILDQARRELIDFEKQYRVERPGVPPALSESAMLWSALTVFRACSFLAHRDLNAESLEHAFKPPCPLPPSPSVCYSVDLTMRFLPDLVRLARAASENDPLVCILMELARQWPLSSVGIAKVGPVDVIAFIEDESLRITYVDRIVARKDQSRLDNPTVRNAVNAAIGLHRHLAPELVTALESGTMKTPAIES
jgi:hypothetical protein